jgi:hypothetical protein
MHGQLRLWKLALRIRPPPKFVVPRKRVVSKLIKDKIHPGGSGGYGFKIPNCRISTSRMTLETLLRELWQIYTNEITVGAKDIGMLNGVSESRLSHS